MLSKSQQEAIDLIEEGKNIFITGPAGTGKSYLLNYLKNEYKSLHITASTGIAAVNVGGQTLHSWAGIGLGNLPIYEYMKYYMSAKGRYMKKKLQSAQMLAIDEISMITPEVFDLLNNILKELRDNDKPFGGLQIILFGDFLQLPPVNKDYTRDTYFCFESEAWQEADIKAVVLNDIFRQQDEKLITMLNNLRVGALTKTDIELLKYCYQRKDIDPLIEPTILGTHNYQVEKINNERLRKLDTESKTYVASFEGKKEYIEFLNKNCIARGELTLKIDSQVMMLKNTHAKEGVINGSIGIVVGFNKHNVPIVKFSNGVMLNIAPEIWEISRYDEANGKTTVEASMEQIPLILAWAITIHKSQGMSLDKIQCALKDAFTEGQIYVAISRVKSIDGLYIENFDINKIRANKKVIEFYKKITTL
ncbi:MAG: AAA family ATPase [Rickettsiales bacterium]|jgi:ATP-dependent exoDNAse (exonuclease V) alpha subunit|nr:AAA family ATPase [Rickettsiales bacterium]